VTANEKALIEAAVKWTKAWEKWYVKGCRCHNCLLIRAVRRVVKERKGKGGG